MNWDRELKYKKYADWDNQYLKDLSKRVNNSKWRLNYHIQPPTGLLNDPNGFSYFNNTWHLFYQYYPFGAVHGLKSWFHLTSKDLVYWEAQDIALKPDTIYDSHGAYSGSAIVIDGRLFINYTGNVRNENWDRLSFQLGAFFSDGILQKFAKPVISEHPNGITEHFRDPYIFKYQDDYYILIGAQDIKLAGQILIYKITKTLTKYTYLGVLKIKDYNNLGFMIECPNIIFINRTPILIFCPQGLSKKELNYKNIYPNTYLIGDGFDIDTLTFTSSSSIKNLDEGFDLYASQVINTEEGRVLAVSWIGLPEIEYPSDQDGWAHCLSIVKELTLKNGCLYQKPIADLIKLRGVHYTKNGIINNENQHILETKNNTYELIINLKQGSIGNLQLLANKEQTKCLNIEFNSIDGTIVIDRSNCGTPFAKKYGDVRTIKLAKKQDIQLQIFMDVSCCEIFINDGFKVASMRIFPNHHEKNIYLVTNQKIFYTLDYWELTKINQ